MNKYKTIILLAVLVAIYFAFIIFSNLGKIFETLIQLNLAYFFIFVGFFSLGLFIRTLRWHLLMQSITKKISFKENTLYYLSGLSMVLSPGRVGEIIRSPFLKRDHGIPISKSVAVVFIERLYELLAIAVIIGFAIFFSDIPKIFVVFPLIIVFGIIITLVKKEFFLRVLNRLHNIKYIKNFIPDPNESFNIIFLLLRPKFFLKGITNSFSIAILEAIGVFYLLQSLNFNFDFLTLTAIFHTSTFIAATSMIPAGIGIWEGGFLGLLVSYDVPEDIAVSATLLIRIIATGAFSLIGLICLRIVYAKRR